MKILTVFLILLVTISELNAGSWCKAIYNKEVSDGEINKQIKKQINKRIRKQIRKQIKKTTYRAKTKPN